MEPEGSSPHSQVPATCPYPEPAQSSPHTPIPIYLWLRVLKQRCRDNAGPAPNIYTNSCNNNSDRSVGSADTY
jgi:hypothetical protein